MNRPGVAAAIVLGMIAGLFHPVPARAQDVPDLSGAWALDPAASQLTREVGFNVDLPPAADDERSSGGGRGRRGAGAGGRVRAFGTRRVSEDEAKRERQLTGEVRHPAARLTIVQTPAAVTVSDDKGGSRTFHPDGKEEVFQLADNVPVVAIARWDQGQLVVLYEVEEGRQIRCSYSRPAGTSGLVLEAQFIEHGTGDKVTRVYERAAATPVATGSAATPAPPAGASPAVPPASPSQAFDQRPGAEFRGLSVLGLVVEGLGTQAAACGLSQDTLENEVSRHLSGAGLTVRRNSDEDTYVYVNVMTASVSNGLCVSRYDVYLTTHTTATLSYQHTPVLVEVSLLHKGGIAGGAKAAHADGVLKGVLAYVDEFAARIHDANR